jgi:hypothetical protein
MINKNDLKSTIDSALKIGNFARKGHSWYLNGPDVIIVVNLQRSAWNEQYYINVGFWLKVFGAETSPKYNHCQLYYRVENLFEEETDLIRSSCSLLTGDEPTLERLFSFIKNKLLPFLLECLDEDRIKSLMAQGKLDRGFVKLEARWHLLGK